MKIPSLLRLGAAIAALSLSLRDGSAQTIPTISSIGLSLNPTTHAIQAPTDFLSVNHFALVPGLRGDIREAEFYDDFQSSDLNPYVGTAPSGQTYAYLLTSIGRAKLASHELQDTDLTTAGHAFYLQVTPGNPVRNFGCTGVFHTGPGTHNSGYSEGVFIITRAVDAGSFLPADFLHIRWFFNTFTVEVTNSGIGSLVTVGTANMNAPIGEEISVQCTLDGNKLTVTFAGQSAIFYSSYFTEATWGSVTYEEIQSGSGNDNDEWRFHSIWANAPVSSIPGVTTQPRSAKFDLLAQGYVPFLNVANSFSANQTITDTFNLNLYGSHGTAGANLHGGLLFNSSAGSTDDWMVASDVLHNNDFAILNSVAAAGNPGYPLIYARGDTSQVSIGQNAASAPATGYALNVVGAGTLNAAVISQAGVPLASGAFANKPKYVLMEDQEPSGTNGGTSASNAYGVRPLNTILTDETGVITLASNQFTLPAGTYIISASGPAFSGSAIDHRIQLYNVTDSSVTLSGTTEFAAGGGTQSRSFLEGKFIISATKAFSIRHFTSSSQAGNGWGVNAGTGEPEIYTVVKLWQQ